MHFYQKILSEGFEVSNRESYASITLIIDSPYPSKLAELQNPINSKIPLDRTFVADCH